MRQEKVFLLLVVVMVVLSMILITGIAYAVETDNVLKISDKELTPEQLDLNVVLGEKITYIGDGEAVLDLKGPTTAGMNITGLEKKGDSVTAIFTIENNSKYIDAEVSTRISNTNPEYFDVTSTVLNSKLKAQNGKTTLEIKVELIKTPIYNDVSSEFCINICANPIDK